MTPTPDAICEELDYIAHHETTTMVVGQAALRARDLIQQQRAEIERLSAALTFYADERNWRSVTVYMCGHGEINCNVMADKGSKARAALGKDASDV